jgi:hypothetical protein
VPTTRTTVTFEEDVAAGIQREIRRTGRPFKIVVNELLRTALYLKRAPRSAPKFRIKARPLGVRPGLDYDRISQLLEDVEGPVHR